tara:strand:- start:2172 stop:3164 length:993 start_codon:yes stop_codon:yes gene_type:complete
MSRIRLNAEKRNKIANRMRVHLEAEDTQEKEKFFQARENFKPLQDETWQLAKVCVERQYPKKDVELAHYLQDKYPNVNTIAKDSCFHFGYMGKPEEDDEDEKYISKHFDFRLNGDIDGVDRQDDIEYRPTSRDFGYAYFRDELKAQKDCNPDITVEMEGKDNNPHWTKFQDANDRYLGTISGRDNLVSYADKWDKEYELDLIGREYCRDRQIAVSKEEFQTFVKWQQAKGQLIMAHYNWIKSVLRQMNEVVKPCLKNWHYLDEAIEFCNKAGLQLTEAEIIKTNSTGLALYNPENAVEMLKSMKNKNVSRADKIKARLLYEKQQGQQSVN